MLTQKRLKEIIEYDQETGVFTWKKRTSNRVRVGDIAGGLHKPSGYVFIGLGRRYKAHRLAWLYSYGYIPETEIDHVNGRRSDNRLLNLRETSHQCNMQNSKHSNNNTSGFKGVSFDMSTGRWKSYIKINYKMINLGRHTDALEAALTRLTLEVRCQEWSCDMRGELVKSIMSVWPEFNLRSLN